MTAYADTAVATAPVAVAEEYASGQIAIEVKRDLDLGPADIAAIDALLEGRPDVGVFVSRAWLAGFFVEPPPAFTPMLVLFRDGAVRGLAPVAVRETGSGVHVSLLGGGRGSDRVDLVAASGFERACADAFVAWVTHEFGTRGLILELRDVPADSPIWGAVARAGANRSMPAAVQPRAIYTHPYLLLAARPRDRAAGGFGGQLPTGLARHVRWLERRGRLRVEVLHERDDVLAAFESLRQFLHVRWAGHGRGSVLDRPAKVRFHLHVIPQLLADGRLRMVRLRSDARTIGVFYGLASGSWQGYYLAGYDREWAGRIHLGQITLAAAIALAERDGAAEFDFLKGVEHVKYLWPVRERTTVDADVYSERCGAHLKRAARAAREAAGAVVKSARYLVSDR